jgi:flagellar basal-body rod protein FlgB
MPLDLNTYLGVQQDALQVYSKRTEVLANNLANSDTPGYKARDVDFRSVLAAAGTPGSSLPLTTTSSAHVTTSATGSAQSPDLKYRVPLAPALDGNTVDVQLEQGAFAENAVRYQATLTFLSDRFKGLMTAITGQ